MNIFTLIRTDHEQVSALFDQMENTGGKAVKVRQRLVSQLKLALDAHTQGEEQVFYPLLEQGRDDRLLMNVAAEEHHLVKAMLQELEGTPPDSERWIAKLTVLRELVEHHVDDEEGEIIPLLEERLTEAQADTLGERMAEVKRTITAAERKAA